MAGGHIGGGGAAIWAACTSAAAVSKAAVWASIIVTAPVGMDTRAAFPRTTITAMGTNAIDRRCAIERQEQSSPLWGYFLDDVADAVSLALCPHSPR